MEDRQAVHPRISAYTWLLLLAVASAAGDLEPTFGRCCAFGANWARESQQCATFPIPVAGVPSEHQSICITAAGICCLRYYRDKQCQQGKQAAQAGQECTDITEEGGEFYKDCCDGCKLGLVSGNMGMGCNSRFTFGFPWDSAYFHCCNQASVAATGVSDPQQPAYGGGSSSAVDFNTLYPSVTDPVGLVPESEDLCARFPGKLCAHVCVPTPGSYRCQCRAGFTLSVDGKTCIQEAVTDRCQINNPCAHICRDTGISIECLCNPGYALARDQRSCEDVDECILQTDNCNRTSHFCVNTRGSFTCQQKSGPTDCIAGYKYSAEQKICIDIDECTENIDSCEWSTQTCVNTVSSYRCIDQQPTCDFGYRYDHEQRACIDINECEEGRAICNKMTEVCINTKGDYWCAPAHKPVRATTSSTTTITSTTTTTTTTPAPPPLPPRPQAPQCPPGTLYNTAYRSCRDIDECNDNPCREFEVCENTQGSYKCSCREGFQRSSSTGECIDLNECQLGLHNCETTQRCDNTIGSYACIRIAGCGTGYTLNHNTGECDDDDECELNTHDCDQLGPKYECFNIKGSFRCVKKICPNLQVLSFNGTCVDLACNPGFQPVQHGCIDINECEERISPCRRNERCLNTHGSYRCRPLLNCGVGYELNEIGNQCVDIDECADGSHQCTGNQLCSNRQGSYICQCPPGYRLNSLRQCQDVNECESYFGNICSNTAVCENTEGSYRCNCKKGFKHKADGLACEDVDECTEVDGICHHNCINVWGSYQCTCQPGFTIARDNRTCTDIDECSEYRGRGRLCIGICVNTPGTFKCSCPDGYQLASDGHTCKDIDECETESPCRGENEVCVNTRGGYKCNAIECPDSYTRDTEHKNRCKKAPVFCRDDDETCRRQPLSYSYNFLPLVSNLTLPPTGQVDLFTMRGPLWSYTTVQFDLELESARAPLGVEAAKREFFHLKRTSYNQAVISLVRPITGPQEVQLALNMQLYHQGAFGG